jgi:large subunit ribosomal protein L23
MSAAPDKDAAESNAAAKAEGKAGKATASKAAKAEKAVKPLNSEKAAKAPKAEKARKAPKAESAARSDGGAAKPRFDAGRLAQVLVEPIVSEKATLVSEKRNQVTFKVLRNSTKPEIKAAVELLFKVEVASVQTTTQKGKVKKFGRSIGRRDHVKKAYVALKPGQELNFSGEAA